MRCARFIPAVLFGSAVLLLGAAALPTAAGAADAVKLSLNFFPYGLHTGFYAAQVKGFYREAGLEVEILKGGGSNDAVQRVGSGAVDFGFGDLGAMVQGRSRGLKLKGIGIVLDKDPSSIYTLKSAGVRTPKDLEGKSIGAASAVSLRDLWPALAAANGVDSAKVTWVDMPGTAYVASLLSKKVDGIATYLTTLPSFEIQARKQGDEIAVLSYAEFGVDTYGGGMFTSEELIRTKPELVRRFVHASLRGYGWAFEHPDEAVQAFLSVHPEADPQRVRQELKITAGLMLTPTAARSGIGTYAEAKVLRTRDLTLKPRGVDPGTIPVKDLYTNEFLPKLFPKSKL